MLPLTFSLLAQTTFTLEVQGQINDGASPIPGATVLIKGEQRSTVSDFNGRYKVAAHPTDTLVISYIGYAIVEEPVNSRSLINISLREDATTLKEVVINAGYYNTTEKERTGSISRVKASEIERQPITNPLEALQGRMSGVNITQNSGLAGGSFSINIRGRNSIRADGNEPLYVIDGVPYLSQSLGDIQVSNVLGTLPSSPLNHISPSDIESVEILKDADATAIYGSRGANGVVLITTKKAKVDGSSFKLNINSGFGQITRTMKLMNTEQYIKMREQAFENDGLPEPPPTAYDINGTWDRNRYTDWQKTLIGGTAYKNHYQATYTGGSIKNKFLVSGNYLNETTVFPGDSKYRRATFLANFNHISDNNRLQFDVSLNYSLDDNDLPATDFTSEARLLAPNAPELYDAEGNLNWENSTWNNPLRHLESTYLAKANNLILNTAFRYKISKELDFKSTMGYNQFHLKESRTNPHTLFDPAFGLDSGFSSIFLNNGERSSWIFEPSLVWNKEFGKSKLNVLVGTTFQDQQQNSLKLQATGFNSNSQIYNIAAASTVDIRSDEENEYRYNAIFGRINYNYNGKYILNLTGRRDGSSRFGPGNRFANFGAIGAAWIFSEEDFVKDNLSFLSFGKIRGSYGTSGNDLIGDYAFLNTYSTGGTNYEGIPIVEPTRLFNPKFAWEINKKLELAVEMGLWNDRIFLTTAYYKNKSSNQLIGVPLPGTTGFNNLQANFDATVQNTGLEVDARIIPVQSAKFKWVSSFNYSAPKNKLVAFDNLESSTFANRLRVGKPLDIALVYQFNGVNPETGVYEFEDFNNDGEITSTDDKQKVVDLSVDYFGGWSNHLAYKNIYLDFSFQFVKQKGYNYLFHYPLPGEAVNQSVEILNNWQEPGDQASIQGYSAGFNIDKLFGHAFHRSSDAAVSDASFVRLKNIEVGYNIPTKWSKGFNCKVFLKGQNVLTFTKFKGPDPENAMYSRLPPLKLFSMGLQLTL